MIIMLIGAGIVHAQTTTPNTTSTTPGTTVTPGVPSTGAGGDAGTNGMLLGASALLMLLGSAYIIRSIAKNGAHEKA